MPDEPVHSGWDGTSGDDGGEGDQDLRPRSRDALFAVGLLAVVMAGLVAVLAGFGREGGSAGDSRLLGQLAPATEGRTLSGDRISIDDYRGRWVVVNFFASWCVPCINEHPDLKEFYEESEERRDAVLIAVTFDNTADDARAFFAERGGGWPVIEDPDGSIAVAYGVSQIPETFVIAPDGTISWRFTGQVTRQELDQAVGRR